METKSISFSSEKLVHCFCFVRCLIIIDGLQEKGMWYGIRGALSESLPYSRIIVTTSTQSIAAACSPERYIYKMRGLGISESRELFWLELRNRAGPTPALEHALEEFLAKCDGLPLALVSVAKYLREKGENVHLLELGPGAFDELERVLMQCYDSLRGDDHRSCLLYLSIFPKGHCIRRKSLMRRWVAEGLVSGDVTRSAEHVARDHFGELVDKNLIEPVLIGSNSVIKKSFRVHDVMLDFLVNKAVSKDMVTLIREDEPLHNKEGAHPVRRLSVHGSTTQSGKIAEAIGLNHVRSLTIRNGGLFEFQGCQFLRVLDLEGCRGIDDWTLHCICKLILLKYLSLRGSDVCQIRKKIKNLGCLQTLDIRETQVNKLPMEVLVLPNLAYLFGQFELPGELEDEKKSKVEAFFSKKSVLRIISGFVMDRNGGGSELSLLRMRFLEKVKIWCKHSITIDSEDLAYSLQKSISKHNGLKSLSINFGDESINFLDSVLLEGPSMLSSIKLRGRLSRLPNFFTLLALYELQLSNTSLSIEDLSGLQQLPQLVYLKLVEGRHAFWGGRFVVKEDGFPSLRPLCFDAPKASGSAYS